MPGPTSTASARGHLSTGIIGTRYLMDTLTKLGHTDLAYKIVTKTTYPSWGHMIKEGATTLWERWEYLASDGMNSHNHIMFGSVDGWFYRILAGIDVDAQRPGFEQVHFKPHPVGDLSHVSASIETQRGKVSSSWRIEGEEFFLKVSIPVNSHGTVAIPSIGMENPVIEESQGIVWREGAFAEGVLGIFKGESADDCIVFNVGSGTYSFRLADSV